MMLGRGESEKDGSETLLIGLSRENVTRLMNDEPIVMSQASHGEGVPKGWTILIMFGETEQAIAGALASAGSITKDTKITCDPRVK